MWYKNIAGSFFRLVTKHACDGQADRRTDGQTDRITTPKTALAQLRRAVETYAADLGQFVTRCVCLLPAFTDSENNTNKQLVTYLASSAKGKVGIDIISLCIDAVDWTMGRSSGLYRTCHTNDHFRDVPVLN